MSNSLPEPEWLSRVGGWKPYRRGYLFPCPVHNDTKPSAYAMPGDRAWIVGCFGCSCDKSLLCSALGITLQELWYDYQPSTRSRATVAKVVNTYQYRDESGRLIFEVLRYYPKTFSVRRPHPLYSNQWVSGLSAGNYRPDPDGVWRSVQGCADPFVDVALPESRRCLYHLDELSRWRREGRSPVIFLVEGEKSADALRCIGVAATCSPHGAGKWKAEYSAALKGYRVVVLPDNDEPGVSHATMVVGSLVVAGINTVKMVRLPGLAAGEDPFDWLAMQKSSAEEKRARILKAAC